MKVRGTKRVKSTASVPCTTVQRPITLVAYVHIYTFLLKKLFVKAPYYKITYTETKTNKNQQKHNIKYKKIQVEK